MKKSIYAFAVAAFVLAGCDKEEVIDNYVLTPQLEVSSDYVVFGASGGSKTVVVASNVDWQCTADGSWFTVTSSNDAVTITATSNTGNANRYGSLTVSGSGLSSTISVGQTAAEGVNLSENGTANSYVCNTSTTYRFDATVKGNGLSGSVGGSVAYAAMYGTTISTSEIVCADLLWEAVPDADMTRSISVIDGDPIYYDGCVYFSTGVSEGNAVIAVENSNGEVLWSWHIWVIDDEIKEVYGNEYYWMDRNLGALNNEVADLNNRGLLYQWGRKDPFLNSYTEYTDKAVISSQVGDGSGVWEYTDYRTKIANVAPGNIDYAVKNPMRFLIPSSSGAYMWYLSWSGEEAFTCYLWGNSTNLSTYEKSIFDPCPVGYTVPVADAWYSKNDAATNEWTLGSYGVYWDGCESVYLPCAGFLQGTDGEIAYVGSYGYYWTSDMYEDSYYAKCMYFYSRAVYYDDYAPPVYGFPIRCMRVVE